MKHDAAFLASLTRKVIEVLNCQLFEIFETAIEPGNVNEEVDIIACGLVDIERSSRTYNLARLAFVMMRASKSIEYAPVT